MMKEHGKSDEPVIPKKSANKAVAKTEAESMEGRGSAKGNPSQQNTFRAQDRADVNHAMERVRQVAKQRKETKFTTLLHHVYNQQMLREAYFSLKKEAAAGVDGQTWQHYGERLEEKLEELSHRLQRAAYQPQPVRRVYIPKSDGKQRPLGIPALEDKIVQRATVEVMNAIYEPEFVDFSCGFRPGRNQHQALDQLYLGLLRKKVNWVLDVDIRAFFDNVAQSWLVKLLEHRIADQRLLRLIQKWLRAGVLEEGMRIEAKQGTPQGGSISPLLANVYLHYAFDLWAQQWCRRQANGEVMMVRFADDIIVGFQRKGDAERFWEDLRERMSKFELELHPEKTRLLEFGRFAAQNRQRQGKGKPETFTFLGFTHICGTTRKGEFTVLRQTIRKRMQAKLREVKQELQRRMHEPIGTLGKWLGSVVRGHIRYYGVPMNGCAIAQFRQTVIQIWYRILSRRSQNRHLKWKRMKRYIAKYIPQARICHPYPTGRTIVTT